VTSLAAEVVDDFTPYGVRAFTTGRAAGSFSTAGSEPVGDVTARWDALRAVLRTGGPRFATARQVHGTNVVVHGTGWEGWLRGDEADGHASVERGTGMAVSIADCVPVFVVHPSGAGAPRRGGSSSTASAPSRSAASRRRSSESIWGRPSAVGATRSAPTSTSG
jgi:hypothetical protein